MSRFSSGENQLRPRLPLILRRTLSVNDYSPRHRVGDCLSSGHECPSISQFAGPKLRGCKADFT